MYGFINALNQCIPFEIMKGTHPDANPHIWLEEITFPSTIKKYLYFKNSR